MKRPRQARRTKTPDSLIVMPKASRSSRPVVTNSTSSFRGARVTDVDDREVFRENTIEDGRHRWVVERTFAWLAQFRRLAIRYERRADIHLAFTTLACAIICLRQIRRFCP